MNVIKDYFAHLTLYVAAAYGIASKMDPSLLPPEALPWIAAVGAVLAAAHQTTVAPNTVVAPPVPPSIVKLHVLSMVVAVLLAVALLSGCSTMQRVFSPNAQPYVTAAVDVAVATAESKGVSAVKINAMAKKALAADTGTSASLAAITGLVNAEIAKLNLPPADLLAAQVLEVALTAAVQQQIGQNPDVAVAQTDIAQVLNAVIAATGG